MKKIIPFFLKTAYVLSFFMIFSFFLPTEVKNTLNHRDNVIKSSSDLYNTVPFNVIEPKVIDTFEGFLTGYGPDCVGCTGVTGCSPSQDVTEGNIYYKDTHYGKLRIIAADMKIPCGTIIRITSKLTTEPILAIVLDRGGAIKGNKVDLLFESELAATHVGFQRDVKYEVLRYGWE